MTGWRRALGFVILTLAVFEAVSASMLLTVALLAVWLGWAVWRNLRIDEQRQRLELAEAILDASERRPS